MATYDVFIRDADEYAGGFEIRVPGVLDKAEAEAEALATANENGDRSYDGSDVGDIAEV